MSFLPSQDKWVKSMAPVAKWVRAAGVAALDAVEQLEKTGPITCLQFKNLEGMIPPGTGIYHYHLHLTSSSPWLPRNVCEYSET